ncbi:MAG: diphthamide synthesis protein, partial [Candidatus Bathyarchaeia archaeon]
MYDFEEEKIIKIIKEKSPKKVLLQFPDGLRGHALRIATKIEELTNTQVVISADPCYGACDLAIED